MIYVLFIHLVHDGNVQQIVIKRHSSCNPPGCFLQLAAIHVDFGIHIFHYLLVFFDLKTD